MLVRLRERLTIARLAGRSFSEAWPAARTGLLDGLPAVDVKIYSRALRTTADAWRAAYNRVPSGPADRAVSELEGYATDGELDAMRREPVA